MPVDLPNNLSPDALKMFVLSLADDELLLGHRDSEWTGYAPILEEDIAFSNIAQDELGHSLVWYTLYQQLGGKDPDTMAFEREWSDFTCCRFVTYPKGDFAYTVVRQYMFDAAEDVRLASFHGSSVAALRDIAEKLSREEAYHILHSQGLVERLGDATDESHQRMQQAVDAAFPQALGMFELLDSEDKLVGTGVFPGNNILKTEWLERVVPVLEKASLRVPAKKVGQQWDVHCSADEGGRRKKHVNHLRQATEELQMVYRSVPGAKW